MTILSGDITSTLNGTIKRTLEAHSEILVGPERRRRYTTDEKLAVLLAADRPDDTVVGVCRRYGIATSVFYQWRKQYRHGDLTGFVPMAVTGPVGTLSPTDKEGSVGRSATLMPDEPVLLEVDLPGGSRLRLRGIRDGHLLRQLVDALEGR